MTPGLPPALAEVGLTFALLAGAAMVVLVVGWSVVWWVDTVRYRRDVARQRLLLAHLYELEVTCGGEFPQVGATVEYVRRLVLRTADVTAPGGHRVGGSTDTASTASARVGPPQEPVDVVVFRATLRGRYGGERQQEGGQDAHRPPCERADHGGHSSR